MTDASFSRSAAIAQSAPPVGGRRVGLSTNWIGVAPFFLFALMFLIAPTAYLVVGAFQNDQGEFTLENIAALSQPFGTT